MLLELKTVADLPHIDTCAKLRIARTKGNHKCENDVENEVKF